MPPSEPIKIIFGAAFFGRAEGSYRDKTAVETVLQKLSSLGINTIDTAQIYGPDNGSETLLGECGAGERFVVDTKAYGGAKPGTATEEGILSDGQASLGRLKMDKVDVFYIHAPDSTVPIASTLAGINALYKRGAFARFGLSNYSVDGVQEVYDHCKEHGYVSPTVYQGHYNAVARWHETKLFPTLRKLGISYYAYSPLAGGFLTKTKEDIDEGKGRFNKETPSGQNAHRRYAKPAMLEALEEWERTAKDEGCERGELAYRWVCFNTPLSMERGDGMIVGCRTGEQVEQVLAWVNKGPLSDKACKSLDGIWERIKHEAPGAS